MFEWWLRTETESESFQGFGLGFEIETVQGFGFDAESKRFRQLYYLFINCTKQA